MRREVLKTDEYEQAVREVLEDGIEEFDENRSAGDQFKEIQDKAVATYHRIARAYDKRHGLKRRVAARALQDVEARMALDVSTLTIMMRLKNTDRQYLSYAIVGTMAEVGVRRPTARALVLESTYHSQVRALI